MKYGNSNTVKGFYNDNLRPLGAMYTQGDLVYRNGIIYRCLQDTHMSPAVELIDYWEFYVNGMGHIRTFGDLKESIEGQRNLLPENKRDISKPLGTGYVELYTNIEKGKTYELSGKYKLIQGTIDVTLLVYEKDGASNQRPSRQTIKSGVNGEFKFSFTSKTSAHRLLLYGSSTYSKSTEVNVEFKDLKLVDDVEQHLLTTNVVREYLQTNFIGTNSDGTLKVLSSKDIDLDKIPTNSRFEISRDLIDYWNTSSPSKFPIKTLQANDTFFVDTKYSPKVGDQDIFYQEITRVNISGDVSRWYRSGANLKASPWVPFNVVDDLEDYKNYITDVVNDYSHKKALYEEFMTSVKEGEYKIWKSHKEIKYDDYNSINFYSKPNPTKEYDSNNYYRIYCEVLVDGMKQLESTEFCPANLSKNSDALILGSTGLLLSRVSEGRYRILSEKSTVITGLKESYIFVV